MFGIFLFEKFLFFSCGDDLYWVDSKIIKVEKQLKIDEINDKRKNEEFIRNLFELGLDLMAKRNYHEALKKFERCVSYDTTNEIYQNELNNARLCIQRLRKKQSDDKLKEAKRLEEEKIKNERICPVLQQ